MVGGRDAAVIVHVELFKAVKISFNLYFPRGENGSWIQNGRFCLFCQWDVHNYLCQGAVAPQGSPGAACVTVGPHPAHPTAVRLGRAWIPTAVSQGLPPLRAALSLLGSWNCTVEVGNKKHSQVFHSDGLSSILTPKAVGTKTGLLPGEHLEGLEAESTSSTWTWGWYKSCFFIKQKHIPHRWVNCDRNRWVHGRVTEANSPSFIFKSSTWTVNILMLVCPCVIWDHDESRGDVPATVSEMLKMEPAAIHHIDHSCNMCYGSISPGIV